MPKQSTLTMFASMLPKKIIIEQLEEAIKKYKDNADSDELIIACSLFLAKEFVDKAHNGDVRKAMDDVDKKVNAINFFNTEKN